MDLDKLDAIADQLYDLPLAEFTAARAAQEKAAKTAGDKELAAAIHALGKPTSAAWLANQLVRTYPAEVTPLLELGAGLREATAGLQGEQLRELGRQQYKLIAALVHQARQLGGTVSADTSRALEATLRAALADESVAEQLKSGRLTEALERTGFPPSAGASTTLATASPVKAQPSEPATKATGSVTTTSSDRAASAAEKRRAAEMERAEHAEQQAKFAAHKAADALAQAESAAGQANDALADATAETDQLRRELDQAITEQDRAERHAATLSAALRKAERAHRSAAQQLEEASRRRRELA